MEDVIARTEGDASHMEDATVHIEAATAHTAFAVS